MFVLFVKFCNAFLGDFVMQGNGKFCVGSSPKNVPVRLELQGSDEGFVNLMAMLDDGTGTCIACFWDGKYDPCVIDKDVAAKLGIQLSANRHILQVAP